VYNDETGRYIGVLERKLIMLERENLRMRALLEMLTGDMWDTYPFDSEDQELFDIAVDAMEKRLGLSREDARNLCHERWEACNPPEPDPSLATYMVGVPQTQRPHVISWAKRIEDVVAKGASFDHKKHLEGLEKSSFKPEIPRPTTP
jgi:hypothetical protein